MVWRASGALGRGGKPALHLGVEREPGAPDINWKDDVGCPALGVGGWVLGCSFSASFRDEIDSYKPRLSHSVEWPTAPRPIFRVFYQSTGQRIAVHVIQFLPFLPVGVHVEVVKARLPEGSRPLRRFWKGEPELSRGAFVLWPPQFPGNPLFQHLQHRGRCAFVWLADQEMHVLRHDHISNKRESVLGAHSRKLANKYIPGALGFQQGEATITTKRQKVQMTPAVMALQPFWHRRPQDPPSHPEGGAPTLRLHYNHL